MATAHKIIRQFNAELKESGCWMIQGMGRYVRQRLNSRALRFSACAAIRFAYWVRRC